MIISDKVKNELGTTLGEMKVVEFTIGNETNNDQK